MRGVWPRGDRVGCVGRSGGYSGDSLHWLMRPARVGHDGEQRSCCDFSITGEYDVDTKDPQ